MAENVFEEHWSPDGLLHLIVTRDPDGDIAIGFDGYAEHTHGDILASLSGLPEDMAIRQFVTRILGDEQMIVIARVNGAIRDVWWTDEPGRELKYKPPEEALEFRYWSGARVEVEGG